MANLRWKIGDLEVTRIVEAETPMPFTEFFENATEEKVAAHRDWMHPDFMDDEGQLKLSIHSLVVQTPKLRILVDTCIGTHTMPGFEDFAADRADLRSELAAAGLPRESIDVVLCTHMHFDHVGWNTMQEDGRWVPTFPNARYLFARKEWEYWKNAGITEATPSLDDAVRPILDAGLADLVDMDHRICDEVALVPTAGHTPGHVSVALDSGGQRAVITGDATHHPVQFAELDWGLSIDTDPAAATATRRRMREAYGDRDVLVIGTHFAGPTAGHVVSSGGGWRFRGLRG